MATNYNQFRQLIFEHVEKNNLWEGAYRIAETSVGCYTNSTCFRKHIESFFNSSPYSIKASGRQDITIYFLTFRNKTRFLNRLLEDLDSLWTVIYKETEFKQNIEIFQLNGNSCILLFRVNYLIGVVNLNFSEGFYLIPEEDNNEIASDKTVFRFILSELFWTKRCLMIHASCMSDANNNGVLIAGSSGSGKTTLCLKLIEKGFNFLSNDLVVLKRRQSYIEAFGFPEKRIKVRKNPASLSPRIGLHVKEWDKNVGYIPVDYFCNGNKKAKCKLKILGIAAPSTKAPFYHYQLTQANFADLIPVINLFIPHVKDIIDRKLYLLSKLFTTTRHFYFFLPRNRNKLQQTLSKNIEGILSFL